MAKIKDLRSMTVDELEAKLVEAKKEQFNLRIQQSTGQPNALCKGVFLPYTVVRRRTEERMNSFSAGEEQRGQRGLRRMSRMRNELLGTMCRPGTGMHQGLRVTCCGSSLSRMK